MSQEQKVHTAMENLKATATEETSGRGSPVVDTLKGAADLAGIGYESGGEGGDGKPVPEFGAPPKPPKTQHGGDEEEGRNKEGGVMHWLGLAGGRKRRRKKSRKKKKKSKSKKRRRKSRRKSRRGGFACPSDKCPCPPMSMFNSKKKKERKMCVDKRASGRAHWFNYKYGDPENKGKIYFERQTYVNANEELKAKREAFVAEGKAIRQANYKKAKGFSDFAEENTAAAALKMAGVDNIGVGGRRRKSRRKKRRKSKKRKSRRRKKSRKRRR